MTAADSVLMMDMDFAVDFLSLISGEYVERLVRPAAKLEAHWPVPTGSYHGNLTLLSTGRWQ